MRILNGRRVRIGHGILWAACVLVGQPAAVRCENAPTPSATEMYTEAQKLFDKGNYADALVGFRQAYNASNSPNARLMVGHCLIALGKPTEAYVELNETMREAGARAAAEPKYEKTRDAAATQLALLEAKVGKVVVEVDDRTVEITVNGVRIGPDKLGQPIAVDPGTVRVTAKHIDGRYVIQERAVAAGKTESIALKLPEGSKADAPVSNVQPPIKDAPARGGGVRIAGGVVMGLGVAGMALFAIAGSQAKDKFATLESECGSARCTDMKYADVIDSGKSFTMAANVGLGVGVAGILSGGLMMILGGPSKAAATVSIHPGGTEIRYRMTF